MARPLILSNGEMHIGLNQFGLVHDFYYPYVGLENHSSQRATRHKIGLFAEGAIHWLDDGTWRFSQKFLPARLIGRTVATNDWLGFAIEFQDFVDSELNVFARNIEVINLSSQPRDAKLFLHQAFIIGEAADGHDTAQYLPPRTNGDLPPGILHYKGKRAFIITGENPRSGQIFDSFSVGGFGHFAAPDGTIENLDGVWRDAEDGELMRNPVERVQTDSILQFNLPLAAHDSARVHYFLAAGKSVDDAGRALTKFRRDGLTARLLKTNQHWRKWLAPAAEQAEVKVAPEFRENFLNSLLITKAMTDRRGAVIASTDTEMMKSTRDAYVDCWPRDAANVLSAYVRLGYVDEVQQFFRFATDVLSDGGFFWQMYRPDASEGPNSHAWIRDGDDYLPPIQTDETARVLMLFNRAFLTAVAKRHDNPANWRDLFDNLARPMADFLADYIDAATKLPKPTYELWEVRFETTTYTTGLTAAALEGAADVAEKLGVIEHAVKWRNVAGEIREHANAFWNERRGYFYRGFRRQSDGRIDYDETIDTASFYGAFVGGLFSSAQMARALATLRQRFNISENNLLLPRFEQDDYHRADAASDGNPWFITMLWLAEYQLTRDDFANVDDRRAAAAFAKKILDFTNDYMAKYNILPEQFNAATGAMISAAPLNWSHGEFLNAVLDYGNPRNDPFARRGMQLTEEKIS